MRLPKWRKRQNYHRRRRIRFLLASRLQSLSVPTGVALLDARFSASLFELPPNALRSHAELRMAHRQQTVKLLAIDNSNVVHRSDPLTAASIVFNTF
jgi:hypothetical protein